jgi:hypothetical protein
MYMPHIMHALGDKTCLYYYKAQIKALYKQWKQPPVSYPKLFSVCHVDRDKIKSN